MYKLVFFVPTPDALKVKEAIFKTGAGSLGNYSSCSFETRGIGSFKPLKGANPTIGEVGKITEVEELRVEILCDKSHLKEALMALRATHPYEEPAFEVYKLVDLTDL